MSLSYVISPPTIFCPLIDKVNNYSDDNNQSPTNPDGRQHPQPTPIDDLAEFQDDEHNRQKPGEPNSPYRNIFFHISIIFKNPFLHKALQAETRQSTRSRTLPVSGLCIFHTIDKYRPSQTSGRPRHSEQIVRFPFHQW